uniref:Oxidoreductase n=1 Tax=Mesocestoides corti TaxID=53468 RepID=A0A5K3FS24_MESCO
MASIVSQRHPVALILQRGPVAIAMFRQLQFASVDSQRLHLWGLLGLGISTVATYKGADMLDYASLSQSSVSLCSGIELLSQRGGVGWKAHDACF